LAKEEQEKKILEKGKEIAQNIPVAQNPLNKADDVALAYTIKNLTKLANALDVNGYAGLANILDGTLNKISSLISKKAFDMGIESIEEDKRGGAVNEIKALLDSGDYAKALSLLSELEGSAADFSDLYSSFAAKVQSEEE
jgi:hypothetical protein